MLAVLLTVLLGFLRSHGGTVGKRRYFSAQCGSIAQWGARKQEHEDAFAGALLESPLCLGVRCPPWRGVSVHRGLRWGARLVIGKFVQKAKFVFESARL